MALWKSLEKHDDTKGLKFSTYFYRGVVIECLIQQKANTGPKKMFNLISGQNLVDHRLDPCEMIDAADEIEFDDDCDLLSDKYLYNMTTREIAEKREMPVGAVRNKILKTRKNRKAACC